jgi:hypothetical protein
MVQASGDQCGEFRFVEREAGGNEIDVEACEARGADEFDDVGAGERFAAGEIGLKNAERGGFVEDARPHFIGKFVGARLQFEWIRTIHAM